MKTITPAEFDKFAFKRVERMLLTAERDGKVNTMTAGWGGFGFMWNKPAAFTVIRPTRFTKEFVDNSDTFSLCFFDECYEDQLMYLGKVSGRDEDKIKKAGLITDFIDGIPYFREASDVLLCRKLYASEIIPGGFIDQGYIGKFYPKSDYHTLYVSEVIQIYLDSK